MKRPIVTVTVTDPDGQVVHTETRSALNAGIRASEAGVRAAARAAGAMYEGGTPVGEGDRYARTGYSRQWTSPGLPTLTAKVTVAR